VLEARNGQEVPRVSGRQLVELLTAARPQMRTLFISSYSDEALSFEADSA
jgi:hypothetical protein